MKYNSLKYNRFPTDRFAYDDLQTQEVRSEKIQKKHLADRMEEMLAKLDEGQSSKECNCFMKECRDTKLGKLLEILYATDVDDTALLETRIYEYGSMLHETDVMHREIFVWLVRFLNLVIK